MEYLLVCATALAAAALTLFSGFGLGTLLLPAFALFFPVDVAIAQTALVHLANNCFKLALFWRQAHARTLLLFGLPAMLAALVGAWLLGRLAAAAPLYAYAAFGREHAVTLVKLVMAVLMAGFAVAELKGSIKGRPMPGGLVAGGLLSGFFGGLSGHQGAFRSAYLLRAGLDKQAFVATGVALACLVDFSRLAVYAGLLVRPEVSGNPGPVVAATLAAFTGSYLSRRWLRKMTLDGVRRLVAGLMLLVALGLALGLI
uniref:Probable membrane transporter protein n=1 Tax=Fundidesulfovibrio putealis TaxID=270496 RepID=A0A7C4AAQ3_9BACT